MFQTYIDPRFIPDKKSRRGSEGSFLEDSPNLSGHSKALAKSTTALSYIKADPNYDNSFNFIRGTIRTEQCALCVLWWCLQGLSSPKLNNESFCVESFDIMGIMA